MPGKYQLRIRSGTCLLADGTWHMVVALWRNSDPNGPPDQQWFSEQAFDALDDADRYYFTHGRKIIDKIKRGIKQELKPGDRMIERVGDPPPGLQL